MSEETKSYGGFNSLYEACTRLGTAAAEERRDRLAAEAEVDRLYAVCREQARRLYRGEPMPNLPADALLTEAVTRSLVANP